MHVVLRGGFKGGGVQRVAGEVVDTSDWRNVDVLEGQNFIRPATSQEIADAEELDTPPVRRKKPTVKRGKRS
jgi:hypothetical protein